MTAVIPPDDARLDLLIHWLGDCLGADGLVLAPASADASFRRYFRVWHGTATLIAMDAPPPQEDVRPFVAIARALGDAGLHVPRVLEVDAERGFLLLSDLGGTHYLSALRARTPRATLYGPATAALLRMQANRGLVAGLARYDGAVLAREVGLFPEWFLGRHLGIAIESGVRSMLETTLGRLVAAAAEQPPVFVHRDYHSRNLMVTPGDLPGILDFQDAIEGPPTYDLVSLHKDCYVAWPRAEVEAWVEDYRQRAIGAGLSLPGRTDFLRWFDLMGAQRHLKVLGIFARLWYRDGKSSYLADLPRVLAYVTEAAALYAELDELRRYLDAEVLPRFDEAQRRALA